MGRIQLTGLLLNIKNKLISFYKREEWGHSHSQVKAKPKLNSVKCLVLALWNALTMLWAPKGLDSAISPALPLMARVDHLFEKGQLHSRAVALISGHPISKLLEPPQAALSPMASQLLFRDSFLVTWWQASLSASLQGLINYIFSAKISSS